MDSIGFGMDPIGFGMADWSNRGGYRRRYHGIGLSQPHWIESRLDWIGSLATILSNPTARLDKSSNRLLKRNKKNFFLSRWNFDPIQSGSNRVRDPIQSTTMSSGDRSETAYRLDPTAKIPPRQEKIFFVPF